MRVSIRESRHDQTAPRVQDAGPGADVAGDLRGVPDGEDLAGRDRDRAGPAAPRREAGPDRTALDDDVCFGATRCDERERGDE